jgi:hypothetical protein
MSEPNKLPNTSVGYETSDAGVAGIMWSGIVLLGLMLFAFVLIWFVLSGLEARHAEDTKPLSPLYTGERILPPEPRLQVAGELDYAAFKTSQDSLVNSYGWVSKEAGVVRIPVSEAMQLAVKRGFPVRTQRQSEN